jgi:hypothetical protein
MGFVLETKWVDVIEGDEGIQLERIHFSPESQTLNSALYVFWRWKETASS